AIASPLLPGSAHRTSISPPSGVSTRLAVGAPGVAGMPAGISPSEYTEKSEGSGAELCAMTRTLYSVPLTSPSHTSVVPATCTFCTWPDGGAGEISSVPSMIGERSAYVALTHVTSSEPSPNARLGAAGGSGRSSGRAGADAGEGSDGPTALCATTVNVYSTSFV